MGQKHGQNTAIFRNQNTLDLNVNAFHLHRYGNLSSTFDLTTHRAQNSNQLYQHTVALT
ncbi:Uncharacterised protein [BD1-7 clade bacterium]|uniref:Uncharacterized protein n=1 Tax=BD1-7 clade bacterium TaxID=2029982 RepID=A0A5S9PCY3_9GAMM|nr:Uncharacterised protein [BD1-7 clade bacterium]